MTHFVKNIDVSIFKMKGGAISHRVPFVTKYCIVGIILVVAKGVICHIAPSPANQTANSIFAANKMINVHIRQNGILLSSILFKEYSHDNLWEDS